MRSGQIELVATDQATIILTEDEADLTQYSDQFQNLRLGPDTGATLYRDTNFEGVSQNLYADIPEIRSTKVDAFPKSIQIWSSIGAPFTGKWIISAGNGQYLHQNKQMLELSEQHLSDGFFSFHYNPNTHQTLLVPANNVEMPLLKVGNDNASMLVVDNSEFAQAAFSIVHSSGDQWLTLLNGTLNWTEEYQQRTLFYRVMKVADSEEQVGEITEGEVALYQHFSYHGKAWVLSDYEPGVVGDFKNLSDFQGLNNTISSIRLGPNTGVTLFANEQQQVDEAKRETQQEDIVDNVPDMGETQIKHDNASSLKIFRTVGAEAIFTSVTSKLSQDYRLVDDELEEFSSYRTILRLNPEVTEVEVSATDLTTIEVEGTLYEIDEDRAFVLSPNLMRQIMITSEAEGLSTPGLKFRTSNMIVNQFVLISPDEEAHQQIADSEDDALWNATDAQGNLIIDQNQHSRSEIASVQSTIKRTMATVVNTPAELDTAAAPISVRNLNSVSGVVSTQQAVSVATIDNPWTLNLQARPITGTIPEGSAGLIMASPNIWEEPVEQNSFEQLFAQAETAVEPVTISTAKAFDGTFAVRSIGGFIGSIGDAIKDATKVTLGVLDGAFNALVEVGGKLVRFVLNTAKKVADFVEAVVKKVVKGIKQFIEFLQFLFDWDDILETKQYLVDSINAAFDYAEELVESAKQPVSDFFDDIEETVEEGLDKLITNLGGDPVDQGPEFKVPEALEWLLNKFMGGDPQPLDFVPEGVAPEDIPGIPQKQFFTSLSQRLDETKATAVIDLFEGIVESIMSLITNPRNPSLIVVQIIEALKELVVDILEILEDLALDFLDLILDSIQKLQDMLNGKFDLPFISKLFDLIGAGHLSPLNLACLFVAIPATVVSKLFTGRKPFESVAPVDFSSIPQANLLTSAALRSVDEQTDTSSTEEDDESFEIEILAWSSVAIGVDFIGGILSAILDFIPEGADNNPLVTPFEFVSLGISWISWLTSFPGSPSMEVDGEILPEMPGGFPYCVSKYKLHPRIQKESDRQPFRERMMWGWRTAVLVLDTGLMIAQAFGLDLGSEENPGIQRMRRSVPKMIYFSTGLAAIDDLFTNLYLASIPSDDEDFTLTVLTEYLGMLPGLWCSLRLIKLPFNAGPAAVSALDIIAMGFSVKSSARTIRSTIKAN